MNTFTVKKTLNNNVLIALDDQEKEVVLIGSGIGFHYKKKDIIHKSEIEKLFVLRDEQEQEQYKQLLPRVDETLLHSIIAVIDMIRKRSDVMLNESVHVALTDHIVFAYNRMLKGLEIKNPFLSETKVLYPFEYEIASEIVDYLNQHLEVQLPDGEIGFIALHVHSAITNKNLSEINKYSQLVTQFVDIIEKQLKIKVDRTGIEYTRLVRHIRYTIERVLKGETVEEPAKIASLLKKEYPTCYNLAWKLIKMMQQTLKQPVYEAEAVYLTMHLQRLYQKYES
ncbi:PtsGHI operon antiterminator [Virgibacillus pantothenticus]|uniref:Transcriptional antiterminator n=1 Tax=Virgibacillus pantothenticus TaxID=1473 RepID=A0A0L0QLV6_VIRPA|nr:MULTISPECIES: transcription antiterminator [Virgibacillus]API93298.1 transcriptional antiterminator [Virgibacillus sp. 6R]KNE19572.1 transcriptional antiterminator [Virgibacillus pantothenticus]MEB5451384.1 transcription antiterminator [Virgibacillus pantothenticus]MEB5455410.1 transcription antiterminator [Virgibacillus pantothenticus]MEB5459562.1 transcription antiterminator [Virgibacillus pantothenticus]